MLTGYAFCICWNIDTIILAARKEPDSQAQAQAQNPGLNFWRKRLIRFWSCIYF